MMRRKYIAYSSLSIALMLGFSMTLNAQKLDKDVKVVKPYEPILGDAKKINVAPVFDDSMKVNPTVNYWIHTRRVDAAFEPKPITPARLVPDPLPRLRNNYLKLGYGTYFTPLAELCVTNGRSKTASYGLLFNTLSSTGNVKLDNGEKVFGGYGNLNALLFGSRFYRKSTLSANAFVDQRNRYFYGYNSQLTPVPDFAKGDIKQTYTSAGLQARLQSTHSDSTKLVYDLSARYAYFGDKNSDVENNFKFDAFAGSEIIDGLLFLGANAQVDYYSQKTSITKPDSTSTPMLITFSPFVSRSSDEWSFKLGFRTITIMQDGKSEMNIYPDINLNFVVVKGIMEPYLGINGNYNFSGYQDVTRENPFVRPGLMVKATDERINFFGGIKGKMSHNLSYDFGGSYAKLDNAHFFTNYKDVNNYYNQFDVVYDNIKRGRVTAELSYQYNDKLTVRGQGIYSDYSMFNQPRAWNLPSLEALISANYNIYNKLIFDASLVFVGKRYAKSIVNNEELVLDPTASLNLGAEYRYTKAFSLFAHIRNLGNMKYYEFNQYPSQRLMAMVGFTFSF